MNDLPEQTLAPAVAGPSSHFSDGHLMEMIQARDHGSLARLRARYATFLKVVGMKVLHNDTDAEDLLQEVMLEIWDRAATYDPQKGQPLSWIATITRRRAIDRLRKRETHGRAEDRFAEENKSHGNGWTHVHEDLAKAEIHLHLERALATLPAAQRHAIQLAYHQEMTQRQIAAHTGIPLGTIKTRLELGLRKMASSLRGFEDLLRGGRRTASA